MDDEWVVTHLSYANDLQRPPWRAQETPHEATLEEDRNVRLRDRPEI